jgi:hypothetical protein
LWVDGAGVGVVVGADPELVGVEAGGDVVTARIADVVIVGRGVGEAPDPDSAVDEHPATTRPARRIPAPNVICLAAMHTSRPKKVRLNKASTR